MDFIDELYYKVIAGARVHLNEISRPRNERVLPKVHSQEDMQKLLTGIGNLKHKAILLLMYSSGIRISELIRMEKTDIDFNLNNSQNILLRAQTAAIERNAIFLVLKIATAIPVRQKSALPFSYCVLRSHDEIS